METNPGNFSSRINGAKRPGQDFIDRFYKVWGKKLMDIIEAAKDYAGETDTIGSNEQGERLQRIEESISRLDSAVGILMERLVVSHQKLIDAHLSMLSQQAEREGNRSAEK